jgi:hypothetical protein
MLLGYEWMSHETWGEWRLYAFPNSVFTGAENRCGSSSGCGSECSSYDSDIIKITSTVFCKFPIQISIAGAASNFLLGAATKWCDSATQVLTLLLVLSQNLKLKIEKKLTLKLILWSFDVALHWMQYTGSFLFFHYERGTIHTFFQPRWSKFPNLPN